MKHKLLPLTFFAGLFLFSLFNSLAPDKLYSDLENRALEQMPNFSIKGFFQGEFGLQYEDYLIDQIVGRDVFVATQSLSELLLGKREKNNIYLGKNQVLSEKKTNSNTNWSLLEDNLQHISNFLNGIPLEKEKKTFIPIPFKSSILSQYLPPFAPMISKSSFLASLLSTDFSLLALPSITSHSDPLSLFYKTDHHWTSKGAFLAYKDYLRAQNKTPLEETDFSITPVTSNFLGSLAKQIARPDLSIDTLERWNPKEDYIENVLYEDKNLQGMYFERYLSTKDNYSYFFNGNQPKITLTSTVKNKEHLLIIGDSFVRSFLPFISSHYEKVTALDLRYFHENILDWITKEQPTEILVLYSQNNLDTPLGIEQLQSMP